MAYTNFHTEEKEKSKIAKGLFIIMCSKFNLWHNRIITSLKYYKLHQKNNESTQDCMDGIRTKAAECQYKEYGRLLTEQFINGLKMMGWLTNSSKRSPHKKTLRLHQVSSFAVGALGRNTKGTKNWPTMN